MADLVGLSRSHMAKQVQDASVVQAGLAVAFDKGLNPADLDGTSATYLRSALALVSAGRGLAVKTANDYYGAAKRGAGFESTIPVLGAPQMDLAMAAQALLINGPISIKKQLSTGVGLIAAMDAAKAQTLRVGKRLVLEAPRKHLIDLVSKDKDALGWSRVSDGQPCHFCAMLVSRGPVYSEQTVRFRAHNGCGCSVRPFFKGEADGGWSPDAIALRQLWDGVDEHGNPLPGRPQGTSLTINEWREFYGQAVNDPGSPVFKTFTEKVARHISSPAIVEARKMAATAYQAQRSAQLAAEKAAREAETAAAKKAAEEEAKKAAAEAAKIKKWKGKPAPVKPVEPKPASTLGPAAFDQWLEDCKKRFKDFADKTGNPKNDLTLSLNWSYFQKVVNSHDKAALTYLKSNHYIDDKLEADALAAMKKADEPIPGAAAAYKKELTSYRNRLTRYKRYVEEWREVNGITSTASGMDGALTFATNREAVEWANKGFPSPPSGSPGYNALYKYTGGSYRPWNEALRKSANPDKVPAGSWGQVTAEADAAFIQAPEDFIVTRGTGWDEFATPDGKRSYSIPPPPPEDLIGTVQTQHGYTSTAMSGMSENSSFGGSVQLKIRVPQGHPVAWVDPFSQYRGEREMLLARSTSMYIHNVYKSSRGHHYVVEAEVIPKDVDPASFAASATPMPASSPFQ
ncbi:capsid maturation protease and VIP2-like ADP-ribosyltransferase toxin [Arthrobacter phage Amyev]|uniref:Capsid maturation protease and VIP2-like ADP-ribosyltransferase toxin n=1 Tax=Arthrobacter phage Amyev TaxID=2832315 RepID=A0AA48Y3R4_9CAUD|nr:head maturation protease [Arthrobacter phage Amyev]UIW13420.1 capsid maturation protease and VIP2-like ADP-ribosyltransferase toxin [Arthrobacter phage Amyev]